MAKPSSSVSWLLQWRWWLTFTKRQDFVKSNQYSHKKDGMRLTNDEQYFEDEKIQSQFVCNS